MNQNNTHYLRSLPTGQMYPGPSHRLPPAIHVQGLLPFQPYPAHARQDAPSQSPGATCYSPSGSLSDGMSDYPRDKATPASPSSLASSRTLSPLLPQPPQHGSHGAAKRAARRKRRGMYPNESAEQRMVRRKVTHSEIEKKRRVSTNDVIEQLRDMVPAELIGDRGHKLDILKGTAKYIAQLLAARSASCPPTEPADQDAIHGSQMKLNFLLL
ncbi:hypothetical protein GGF46_000761 [Coemansia sp. RSA 552]|nr:hypothetical protein GGF46_000761 [Coemansia sp. RSA 552]